MSAPAFSILDAIGDKRLFGSAFKDPSTWRAWVAFLAALFALPMSAEQAEVWRACTGRSALPDQPFREAWLVCGRRSGKSFIMALIAVYLGCFRNYKPFLGPGERATVMVIAADKKQARQVLRFMRGLLSAPVLAARVVNDVSDSIELQGDVTLEVITASHAVRGYSVAAALVDELAFFPSDDASVSGAEIPWKHRPDGFVRHSNKADCDVEEPFCFFLRIVARCGDLHDPTTRRHRDAELAVPNGLTELRARRDLRGDAPLYEFTRNVVG
jgi:hypothetical protein